MSRKRMSFPFQSLLALVLFKFGISVCIHPIFSILHYFKIVNSAGIIVSGHRMMQNSSVMLFSIGKKRKDKKVR